MFKLCTALALAAVLFALLLVAVMAPLALLAVFVAACVDMLGEG